MKKIIIMSVICSIFGFMGCKAQNSKFKTVDAKEFAGVIADTSVVLLDVRTAEEYSEGHIKEAMNIDVLKADFEKKVYATIPVGTTIALYCRSGNRSKKAAAILAEKYKVIELGTGYTGWIKWLRSDNTGMETGADGR